MHNQTCSLDLGDCIGMESCVDLKGDLDDHQECVTSKQDHHHRLWGVKKMKKEKEYPPPLPHMPWVMKRYYTSDGRLIINEEKVDRHEYLHAHRANGCLTLHLVPLNDTVSNHDYDDSADEGFDDDDDDVVTEMDGYDDVGGDEIGQDRTVEDESKTKLLEFGSGLSKCYKFDTSAKTSSSSSIMFSMAVPATRPVHI